MNTRMKKTRLAVGVPQRLKNKVDLYEVQQWIEQVLLDDDTYVNQQVSTRTLSNWFADRFQVDFTTNSFTRWILHPYVEVYGDKLGLKYTDRYICYDKELDIATLLENRVGVAGVIRNKIHANTNRNTNDKSPVGKIGGVSDKVISYKGIIGNTDVFDVSLEMKLVRLDAMLKEVSEVLGSMKMYVDVVREEVKK